MSISAVYGNKATAIQIADDLTGFIYYPDGKIALCEAAFSDYQNNHYCYDKNGSLLVAFDALGIGFAQASTRKDADLTAFSITFTEKGGLISNNNTITSEWNWAHSKGQPTAAVRNRLNEHFVFVYENRATVYLEFECDGIKYIADLGVKQRRKEASYLSAAKRDTTGKLVLPSKAKTLKQRTEDFNNSMLAKHNLVHPKSENLSDMVSGIVKTLEDKFDDVHTRMMTSPSPGQTWKGDALANTVRELPKIPMAGTETGKITGLGSSIYTSLDATTLRAEQTLPSHLITPKGTWKNDTDVRMSLQAINPVLKRTNVLKCNSGRYSNMLVVEPGRVTAQNPTGMVVLEGLPLELLKWTAFKGELEEQSRSSTSSQLLTVGVIGRLGESRYGHCLRQAEMTNKRLQDEAGTAQGFRMVRFEVGENTNILRDLSVKYLPTFVMWSGSRMVYKGQAGGVKVSQGPAYRPKVMLIENQPKFQLATEKLLKKANCDSYLCLTASAALDALHNLTTANSNDAFDIILVSADLIESSMSELSILRGKLTGSLDQKRTIVVAMVNVVGDQGVHNLKAYEWDESYCCADLTKFPASGRLVQQLTQKPMKAAALSALLSQCTYKGEDLYVQMGVTPESLLLKMKETREAAISARSIKDESSFSKLHLSIQDAKYHGASLVK